MYIWFQLKTPDLSKCQYNTPLFEVRNLFLGHDLGQFSFLLGVLDGFRIRSQASRHEGGKAQTTTLMLQSYHILIYIRVALTM